MGNQCNCCTNDDKNKDIVISKSKTKIAMEFNKILQNNQIFYENIASKNNNQYNNKYKYGTKSKTTQMKEMDSLEPIHQSDFENPSNPSALAVSKSPKDKMSTIDSG